MREDTVWFFEGIEHYMVNCDGSLGLQVQGYMSSYRRNEASCLNALL